MLFLFNPHFLFWRFCAVFVVVGSDFQREAISCVKRVHNVFFCVVLSSVFYVNFY